MAIRAILAASLVLLWAAGPASAQPREADSSPSFGERSLYLLHIPFLAFGPADPAPLEAGASTWLLKSVYATTFSSSWHALTYHRNLARKPFTQAEADQIHGDFPEERVFLIEGDVLRTSITARYGITPTLSASAEVVYISHDAIHGGSAVESFHRAFGLPQSGRDEFPSDGFYVLLQPAHGPMQFDDRTPDSGLGDSTATLSWRPEMHGGIRYGIDVAAKAPTGSSENYNGSGSWDFGILGLAQWPGERWNFDAEAGVVRPGRWTSAARLRTTMFSRILLGASRRFGDHTRLGVSATVESSPFQGDHLGDVSAAGAEIALGISHEFPRHWSAALTLLENIPSLGDRADFGLALSLRWR